MIKFDFDRDGLTAREAQLVATLIAIHWQARRGFVDYLLRMAVPPMQATREELQDHAEQSRELLSAELPDLNVRWTWEESPPRQTP